MSLISKIKGDKAGTVLFLMSFSVILITLGIIQTLLFESLTFFQEVASERGWFSLEFNAEGIFSTSSLAALVLIACLVFEIASWKDESFISKIPNKIWFPNKYVANSILAISVLQFIFIKGFLLNIAILFAVLIWRKISGVEMKRQFGGHLEFTNTWRNLLGLFVFISLFDAFTMNYGGAIGEFFLQTTWNPTGSNLSFGVNSLLLTTLQVAFGALIIAVPLGVGTAIYLSEYAHPRLVAIVKPTLEILAGIPSGVYGFFAFIYIGPLVVEFGEYAFANGWIAEPPTVMNPINGAIVVGVMILPLIASMSEDALRAVPNELREGSLALGATKIETTFRVMIQASLSGIVASIILALSRAVGETMAVTLAVGTIAVFTSNMFVPAQTMTAYIAQRVGGDLPFGEIGYLTIFAVGLYLFVITLCLNLLGNKVLSAYREAY